MLVRPLLRYKPCTFLHVRVCIVLSHARCMLVSSFCHGKPDGLCHLLKCIQGALCCQLLQVRRDDFLGSRVRKIHSYHAPHRHLFMHSSISPMIDVGVLIQTGLFILVNMGSNQAPLLKKRFYQVKIKSLEVTSL